MDARRGGKVAAALWIATLVLAASTRAYAEAEVKIATEADKEKLEAMMETYRKEQEQFQTEVVPSNFKFKAIFPQRANLVFPVGEESTAVVGIRVTDALSGKVSCKGLIATIGSPYNTQMILQRFNNTEDAYATVLSSGEDKTVHVKFTPDRQLQTREFNFQLTAECAWLADGATAGAAFEKNGQAFFPNAFNATVKMVDDSSAFDFQLLFLLAVFGAIAIAVLYAFTGVFETKNAKGGAPKAKRVETGTGANGEEEWLKGTHYKKTT